MTAASKTGFEKLREPFPDELIGTIPKGGIQLSYVGHAHVTDRLLQVDPEWTWEPMGLDEHGNPILVQNENGNQGETYGLWIKLTVNGITRPGFGGGKNAKECISDAIRNAAMRFGVALDLWMKDDVKPHGATPKPQPSGNFPIPTGLQASDAQMKKIRALADKTKVTDEQLSSARGVTYEEGKDILDGLTKAEATELIGRLTRYEESLAAA